MRRLSRPPIRHNARVAGRWTSARLRSKLPTVTSLPALSIPRRRLLALSLPVLALLGACDRVKNALRANPGDPVWQGDSALLASKPTVLFRVVRGKAGTRIIPIATAGKGGFGPMLMGDRGWRLFDLEYLHGGHRVLPIRDGDLLPSVAIDRGMWEGSPLDTVSGCQLLPPAAQVALPGDVQLVASGERLPAAGVSPLSAGEREAALASIATLIAPSAGVAPSVIGRYARNVYVVPTGASRSETIVVTYDDPESLPDSLPPIAQRPRQLVVVLDKGVYGYKPTYVFKTVGNAKDMPRRRFLGAFDANADGKAELFFGLQDPRWTLVTYALRWEVDAWHEGFKYERGRCHG